MTVKLVTGATGPALTFQLLRDTVPLDLTGATVSAIVNRANAGLPTLASKTLVIVDPPGLGKVQLFWDDGDIALGDGFPENGQFDIDIYVTLPSPEGWVEIPPISVAVLIRAALI